MSLQEEVDARVAARYAQTSLSTLRGKIEGESLAIRTARIQQTVALRRGDAKKSFLALDRIIQLRRQG